VGVYIIGEIVCETRCCIFPYVNGLINVFVIQLFAINSEDLPTLLTW